MNPTAVLHKSIEHGLLLKIISPKQATSVGAVISQLSQSERDELPCLTADLLDKYRINMEYLSCLKN